jgi:hypothetical protein
MIDGTVIERVVPTVQLTVEPAASATVQVCACTGAAAKSATATNGTNFRMVFLLERKKVKCRWGVRRWCRVRFG